ncbi:hypothetical protein [Kitasatospora sp. NPDC094011]|uniref:LppU/SCO3897 family protein n=1 Tax=Kitasatospora sp. NPDC094011 TaxID=3364090 RepID=UPI0038115FB6
MSTPTGPYGPPPTAAPGFGPPPPSYAQPPYAQQPYAQPPYAQQPPAGPYGYPQPGATPPPPKRTARSKLRIAGVLGGCVALAVGYFLTGPGVSSAKPGDCVRVSGPRAVEIVNCTDSKANYKVLSTFTGTTDVTRCRQTPQTTSAVSGKSGRRWNKTRYVLCLGPLTPTAGYPPVKKS